MSLTAKFNTLLILLAIIASGSFADDGKAQMNGHANQPVINAERLSRIDRVVDQGINSGQMPGCVVLITFRGETIFEKAYGNRSVAPERTPMNVDTVFDLASLTKPIATATAIAILADQKRINFDDRVAKHLPEFNGQGKSEITIQQLLTHQSGLIADNSISDYADGREQAFQNINRLDLKNEPGEAFVYSDVGFIVLGRIVERLTGKRQDEFVAQSIFEPLKMRDTGYLPSEELRQRAAPTEKRDDQWLQGEVHDPRAARMNGVAGHAGLFSTARDLSRFAAMLLGNGELEGSRILSPDMVRQIMQPVQVSRGVRSLGWDMQSPYSSNKGDLLSDQAVGHGGFTGTAIWIDPEQQLSVVFLSNRLHPDGEGSVNTLIGRIVTIAVAAIPANLSPTP